MTTFDPRAVHSMPAQQYGTPRNDTPQFGAQGFPGQQFPGPVPPPPLSRPPRARRPLASKIVAGLVAAGLVVGGAGTWMAVSGSSAEAAVQTTSFAGANPTTSPFGTDAPQVAAVAATGPQSGDTAGLYATTNPASCTTADYLTQLQADPAKLAAVGGVFGLGASDVPAFVNSLSPVVLRAATSVTDHPYADGAFTEEPAILAAGTAVLVNSYGEPTVKCFNGNPLTGGAPMSSAVTVDPTEQVIAQYSFTTVDNSSAVVTPGKPDPKPNKGPNPVPDPVLKAKADAAKKIAEQSSSDAKAARERADKAGTDSRILRSEASRLTGVQKDAQTAFDTAIKDFIAAGKALTAAKKAVPPDPAAIEAAKKAFGDAVKVASSADKALQDAKTAATQADKDAKNAETKAKNAETTAKELEDKAKADQQAADKAKQEAKDSERPDLRKPEKENKIIDDEGNAAKVKEDPTTVGPDGEPPIDGQTPTKACGIADAATTECTPPTGTADTVTGTTPATGTTPGTGTTPATGTAGGTTGGSASTGSTGTGSGSSSSGSSSSSTSGGSQSSGSEGADK